MNQPARNKVFSDNPDSTMDRPSSDSKGTLTTPSRSTTAQSTKGHKTSKTKKASKKTDPTTKDAKIKTRMPAALKSAVPFDEPSDERKKKEDEEEDDTSLGDDSHVPHPGSTYLPTGLSTKPKAVVPSYALKPPPASPSNQNTNLWKKPAPSTTNTATTTPLVPDLTRRESKGETLRRQRHSHRQTLDMIKLQGMQGHKDDDKKPSGYQSDDSLSAEDVRDQDDDYEGDDDEDDDANGASISSIETEDGGGLCGMGVIAVGIPDAAGTPAPPPSLLADPSQDNVEEEDEQETPPRTVEEANQRRLSFIVAKNMAEEEHNIKAGEKARATSSMAVARRRTSTRDSYDKKPPAKAHDAMMEAKRLERERSRSLSNDSAIEMRRSRRGGPARRRQESGVEHVDEDANAKRIARSYSSDESVASRIRLPTRTKSSASGGSGSGDESYSVAVARARARGREENAKMRAASDTGPALAPATSTSSAFAGGSTSAFAAAGPSLASPTPSKAINPTPGAVSIDTKPVSEKGCDTGPSLAPAVSNARSSVIRPDDEELEVQAGIPVASQEPDIEAQAGVAVLAPPGAFAIQGLESGQTNAMYDSDLETASNHSGSGELVASAEVNSEDRSLITSSAFPAELAVESSALEAELQVVVDGAVINDEDDALLELKTKKRLRKMMIASVCFFVAAMALIIGSVLGFSGSGSIVDDGPGDAWKQAGSDLLGPRGEPQVFFGHDVAISGDGSRLAVAAPGADLEFVLTVGQVWVFDEYQGENGTEWNVTGVIAGEQSSDEAETSIAMSGDGSRIVLGRPRLAHGVVQTYDDINQVWSIVGEPLQASASSNSSSWFGYSVGLTPDGQTMVVGAPLSDTVNGAQSGLVRVYRFNPDVGDWVPLGEDILGSSTNEFFGWSVTIQGSSHTGVFHIAVGCPVSGSEKGLVRLYQFSADSSSWTKVGDDLVGETELGRFGESVAMSEDANLLVVGASGTAFEPGRAHIFRRDSESDSLVTEENGWLLGMETGEGFGSSVSISMDGNMVAIGGPQSSSNGANSGRVQVLLYDTESGEWLPAGRSVDGLEGEEFGSSVVFTPDGTRLLVGAPLATFDGSITQAGTARVFDRLDDILWE